MWDPLRSDPAQISIFEERGGGVWDPKVVYQKWPDQIFPNSTFPFLPQWSLWSLGSGGGGVPPVVNGHSNTSLLLAHLVHPKRKLGETFSTIQSKGGGKPSLKRLRYQPRVGASASHSETNLSNGATGYVNPTILDLQSEGGTPLLSSMLPLLNAEKVHTQLSREIILHFVTGSIYPFTSHKRQNSKTFSSPQKASDRIFLPYSANVRKFSEVSKIQQNGVLPRVSSTTVQKSKKSPTYEPPQHRQ